MPPAQTARETIQHQVAGFTVTEWPGTGPTVFGLSGLGSHAPTWAPMARTLPDTHFWSIDLRGRGAGQGMTGPTGLRQHAQDVAAVLAELGLTDVVLIGHSMGAYLAPVVAQEAPDRIKHLVLVDGGILPTFPFFMGPRLTKLTFGKQLRAADRAWPSVEALARKGRLDKMLADRPDLTPEIMAILVAEVGGTPGALRPRLDVDRAVQDAVDCFFGPDNGPALDALSVPAYVFLAENMKKAGQRPFISDSAVAPWLTRQPLLHVRRLPGNHLTVLFAPEVAEAVLA